MALLLWILAVILVVSGIVSMLRGQILWGVVLIVIGLLVGPGGVSIFDDDGDDYDDVAPLVAVLLSDGDGCLLVGGARAAAVVGDIAYAVVR
jgi:hypothetical protein